MKPANSDLKKQYIFCCLLLAFITVCPLRTDIVYSQESTTTSSDQLPRVEIEAPRTSSGSSARATAGEGFGYDQPIPSGQPFSDYAPTTSEVVSATRGIANIATIPSAVSVIDNRGISSLGNTSVTEMLQGQTGLYTPSLSGTPINSSIVLRGFSNEAENRVAYLVNGRSLNIPRTELNTNFLFPESVERIEILRGDATIQFGNNAIGGAVNVILKNPRLNPGSYFGVEGGSWHTDREWAGINVVRDSIAAGVFLGRYYQEGWRIYEGNGVNIEPVTRPGPWTLQNFTGNFNWKINSSLTFDIMTTKSNQREINVGYIEKDQWDRRDIRNIAQQKFYGNGPDEKNDTVTIAKLLYEGGRIGRLETIGSARTYDRRILWYALGTNSDQRWDDFGLSLVYTRKDEYEFFKNDITLGMDIYDGRFRREARYPHLTMDRPPYNTVGWNHAQQQSGYRDTTSYYVINSSRFWDRLIVGLGYRIESYDLRNLYANNENYLVTNAQQSLQHKKSASQWSLGFVYDKELGSNLYYKHSRFYRFPNFDEMINYGTGWPPSFYPPFWMLNPEEGTSNEFGLRHWLTRNIYFNATYYDQYMDSEILYGADAAGNQRNLNVSDVDHTGFEIEGFVRITPRWMLKGNYTRQKVVVRSNFRPDMFALTRQTTEDKWVWQNPADLANLSLSYDNREWGFSGMIAIHYVGSQYRVNDPFNETEPLEHSKWGDLTISQKFFDDTTTIYFGIRNFSDRQYSLFGTRSDPSFVTVPVAWYSNEGRTYFMGLKANLDYDRMKLPSSGDLERMQRRLYGSMTNVASSVYGVGQWMRGLVSF
ncbi:MAG: TonB-dependent receptor [Syntrophaceae bacterium]|nr:TonB-dependent receptor [Syntrophaceae bacterium]